MDMSPEKFDAMDAAATEAAEVLKALSNPQRLRLLCSLLAGPRSVGELEQALGASQSYVSGQLARLRSEGMVQAERDGRTIYYSLADTRVIPIIDRLYDVFCPAP
ncbi:MAG: metalloregulator ArsR/SmtB family transcription factor [Salibaculum sp.]|uniref:ArsR/SmtB family transcription factor n=1 Tax=Salibaculum sp. TaxID=2855480 RepID=UPI0028707943|nr:metalloregulator ArsR/SmtB family transcription factor [Salibaculum sp.]MDR9428594.1 metalloregulator ArsR/SmtB family transcription factor [Salibaculum sp.]